MGIISNVSQTALDRHGVAGFTAPVAVQRVGVVNFALTVRAPIHCPIWASFLVFPFTTGG